MMHELLFCCDWGTTSFRLWLVGQDREVKGTISAPDGIAAIFASGRAEPPGTDKSSFFLRFLLRRLNHLAENAGFDPAGIPVVVSGMASSSIGLLEIPYAGLPFETGGNSARLEEIASTDLFPHSLFLVSGVKSGRDVMRGEETQLVGLAASREQITGDYLLILPGTHSKHLRVRDNRLTDFKTYMTGELYSVLASHSILRESVDTNRVGPALPAAADAFRRGVREAKAGELLHALFSVRTNQLFNRTSPEENACYLSGLLIGAELAYLVREPGMPLVLYCGGDLYAFYSLAMDELGLSGRTIHVQDTFTGDVVIHGQLKILENYRLCAGRR